MHILTPQEISLEHQLESGYSFAIENNSISLSKDNEAYCTYAEEADDDANKVSRRPEAHPAGERIVNQLYLTGNYHLQGGNLQAEWFHL